MEKISFAERLRASVNKTFCSAEARQLVFRELCEMRLSDIFPDYYNVMFESVKDEEKRREVYETLTYGDIAENAVTLYRDHDPCSVGVLLDALVLPFKNSMSIEDDIQNHRIKRHSFSRSRFDYRFWNDFLFRLKDAKKARGFYFVRMFTFREYFDTLLAMTGGDERIERARRNYIVEYDPYFGDEEDGVEDEMHFSIDDSTRYLWWELYENDNHLRSYQKAYELLAVPISILNKQLHRNENQRREENE